MKKNLRSTILLMGLIIALVFTTSCSKQNTDQADEAKAFVADFSSEEMMAFIESVASVDNARITGFEGEHQTADKIQETFESLGLETSVQSFPIQSYALNSHSVQLVTDGDRLLENANPLSYSIGTSSEGLLGQVVSVGLGAEENYKDVDVTGKIVLIQRGGEYFYVKNDRAFSHGAVGAIFYDPNGESISATLTHLSEIPAVSITKEDATWMEQKLLESQVVEVKITIDAKCEDSESKNVIGIYRSKDNKDGKKVIVGAHYDGVNTPAANDNASGTAVVLEMARALAEQKVELPFDVQFMTFGAEEIGLVGSDYYASQMTRDEIKNTICMINFDMVGVGDGIDISTAGDPRALSLVKQGQDVFKEIGFTATTSESDRSDHASFATVGVKAIYIQATPDHNYHTDEDTIDKIDPEMLKHMCDFGTKMLMDVLAVEN